MTDEQQPQPQPQPLAPTLTSEQKTEIANNIADNVVKSQIVQDVINGFKFNLSLAGIDPERGFWHYGLEKIAAVAGQVAHVRTLGIDPEQLLMTDEEADNELERLVSQMTQATQATQNDDESNQSANQDDATQT